jgi:hypothetical protein
MPFNIEAARKSGKTDDEIAGYLGQTLGFDMEGAKTSGKTSTEIANYLSTHDRPKIEVKPEKSIGGFISNVGTNVGDIAKGVATAVTHPIQTVKNVATGASDIMLGAAEKIAGAPSGSEEQAAFEKVSKPFVEGYKNPIKIPGMVFDYLYEKPVDTAMLASAGLGLAGKAAKTVGLAKTGQVLGTAAKVTDPLFVPTKIAKPVTRAVGRVGRELEGAFTGGGPGFIEEAVKGNPAFTKAMRGKITGEEIVNHAKDALQSIRDQRGSAYRNELAKVRATPGALTNVKTSLDQELTALMQPDQFQIGTSMVWKGRHAKNKLDFSQSPLVKNRDVVGRAIEDVTNWRDNTALGLDNLKKRLSKYIDQVERQSPAEAFLTRLEKNLNDGLKGAVPEYAKMTKGYADATNLIKDIESNLMLRKEGMSGRITADNTLRRLSSALRENFEMRKDLLEMLGTKSGKDIIAEVAGQRGNQWIPRGSMGKVLAGGGGVLAYFNPKFWPILVASSPRVVGEFLNAYGWAARKMAPVTRVGAKVAEISTKPEILAPLGLAGRVEKPTKPKPDVSSFEE